SNDARRSAPSWPGGLGTSATPSLPRWPSRQASAAVSSATVSTAARCHGSTSHETAFHAHDTTPPTSAANRIRRITMPTPFRASPLPPDSGKNSGAPLPDSDNKRFMRAYVKNVIDAEDAARGDSYFAENFFNHDPAPGEHPGLSGVKAFIGSIFSAFSGFRTN